MKTIEIENPDIMILHKADNNKLYSLYNEYYRFEYDKDRNVLKKIFVEEPDLSLYITSFPGTAKVPSHAFNIVEKVHILLSDIFNKMDKITSRIDEILEQRNNEKDNKI
jgi:mevalonate kinase